MVHEKNFAILWNVWYDRLKQKYTVFLFGRLQASFLNTCALGVSYWIIYYTVSPKLYDHETLLSEKFSLKYCFTEHNLEIIVLAEKLSPNTQPFFIHLVGGKLVLRITFQFWLYFSSIPNHPRPCVVKFIILPSQGKCVFCLFVCF